MINKYFSHLVLVTIGIVLLMVFWQEYQFKKQIDLKKFEICMGAVPQNVLSDYDALKANLLICDKI